MKINQAKMKSPENLFGGVLDKNIVEISRNVNIFTENRKGEYYYIPLSQLLPFHRQARQNFDSDSIDQLAATILKFGLRQPLTVIRSPQDDTKYEIVSGERRFRAAKKANLDKVPCIILQDINTAEEIAIIENIQREDLHPIELGKAYKGLIDSGFCKTQVEVARILDVPRSQVVENISYLTFSESVKKAIFEKKINRRESLRKLLALNDQQLQLDYIYKVKIMNAEDKRKIKLVSIFTKNGQIDIELGSIEKLSEFERQEFCNKLNELLRIINQHKLNSQ